MIHQFLNQVPFQMPESVWNTHRDNLPWTLKLKEFSLFNLNADGEKIFILDPITTSCTIGVNCKDEGIGLCVHADMSPLKVSINEQQMSQIVQTVEKIMLTIVELSPTISSDSPPSSNKNQFEIHRMTNESSMEYSVKMRNKSAQSIQSQVSMPMRGSSEISKPEPKRLARTSKTDSSLSIWVQWSCGAVNLNLVTNKMEKLQIIIEDYQSSFDWCPVYFQTKVRVFNANVKHFQMKDKEWKPGANNGVILTFGNQITNDIVVINAQTSSLELLCR